MRRFPGEPPADASGREVARLAKRRDYMRVYMRGRRARELEERRARESQARWLREAAELRAVAEGRGEPERTGLIRMAEAYEKLAELGVTPWTGPKKD